MVWVGKERAQDGPLCWAVSMLCFLSQVIVRAECAEPRVNYTVVCLVCFLVLFLSAFSLGSGVGRRLAFCCYLFWDQESVCLC